MHICRNPSSNLSSKMFHSQNSGSYISCFSFFNYTFILLICTSSSFPSHPHLCIVMMFISKTFCAGMSPTASRSKVHILGITHHLLYSFLPHRYLSHALHLCTPPQPEGVAKPRGRSLHRRAGGDPSRPKPAVPNSIILSW